MKTILLLLLVAVLTSSPANAQWQSGNREQPQRVHGNGAIISVDGVLYFWNETNHLQRSTDNGQTWINSNDTDLPPGANQHITRLTYADGRLYGNLSFGSGTGLPVYTTDGGDSWKIDTLGAPGHALGWDGRPVVSDIVAWDNHLFVKWDGPLLFDIKSFTGPFIRNQYLVKNQPNASLKIGNTLHIMTSKLVHTTDHGQTWIEPKNVGLPAFPMGKLYADGSRIYIFGKESWTGLAHLYFTDDAGESWSKIDMSAVTNIDGFGGKLGPTAFVAHGSTMFVATQQISLNSPPVLFESTDDGATWRIDTVGFHTAFAQSIYHLEYHDDGTVWAVPSHYNIYKKKISGGPAPGIAGTPRMISPADGKLLADSIVKFVWGSLAGATSYQLQVATDAAFTSIVRNDSLVTDTFKVVAGFTRGSTYHWRVRGLAPGTTKPKGGIVQKISQWSARRSFTIATSPRVWEYVGKVDGFVPSHFVVHKNALYAAANMAKVEAGKYVSNAGLYRSTDGESWTNISGSGIDTMQILSMVSAGERLYVHNRTWRFADNTIAYTIDGETWITDTLGLNMSSNGGNAFGGLYYWNGHLAVNDGVFLHDDNTKAVGDASWKTLDGFDGHMLASIGDTLIGIHISTIVSKPLVYTMDFGATSNALTAAGLPTIGLDKLTRSGSTLYVVGYESAQSGPSIYRSTHAGSNWTRSDISQLTLDPKLNVHAPVQYLFANGENIWMTLEYNWTRGVTFRSTDGGTTWSGDTLGLTMSPLKGAKLTSMIEFGGYVYAIDPEMGIYRQRVGQLPVQIVGSPELVAPADGALLQDTFVTIMWSEVSGASSYQMQVSTDASFNAIVVNDSLINGTSRLVTGLQHDQVYYWRVRGLAPGHIKPKGGVVQAVGSWSPGFTFRTPESKSSVGMEEQEWPIALYPNPATDRITLSLDGERIMSTELLTISGQSVMRLPSNAGAVELSVTDLASGPYIVRITLSNGAVISRRVVVR